MSVASRIQEIETHIGDIYDTLEVGGTDLTDLNKNIVNINSSLKDRYKYFLNNGVEIIWNNWEKVIGTGTEFTLNNTTQAPMKINLKGNTYQKSTTGKNLIYPTTTLVETTINGVTFTPIYDDNGSLLYVNANGTASADTSYPIISSSNRITLPAGSYITNGCKGGSSNTYWLKFSARNIMVYSQYDDDMPFTLSAQDDFWINIEVKNGIRFNNVKFYPMVRLSTITDSTYEPYTNGTSPNPDYPQDIQVVSGDNTIEIVGKNLLDRSTCEENKLIRWVQGDTYNETGSLVSDYIRVNVGDTIYSTYGNQKCFYDKNKNYIGTLQAEGTVIPSGSGANANPSFTVPDISNIYYLRLGFRASYARGTNLLTADIMVNKGTALATYEPYQKESYPINLGDIELCKIGDYQDYFYKESGKWYLHKEIRKGTISTISSVGTASTGVKYALVGLINDALNNGVVICKNYVNSNDATKDNSIRVAGMNLFVYNNRFTNSTTALNLLNGLNYYYQLSTPTTIEITDTTLLSQLEAIKYSYDTQTNISQVNNDMPFKLEVTALKNI